MADSGGLFGLRRIRSGLRRVRRQLADGPPRTFASNFRLSPPRTKVRFLAYKVRLSPRRKIRRGQKSAAEEVRRGQCLPESAEERYIITSISITNTKYASDNIDKSYELAVLTLGSGLGLGLGLGLWLGLGLKLRWG